MVGGGFDRVRCDWFHCPVACVVGFGCGSVMIGVTPDIGCVCDTM